MIHPDSERAFVSPSIGWGVRATRTIPRGSIVWARDRFDLAFTDAERARLPTPHRTLLDRYGHREPDGVWLLCWDDGRLVNHSCEPNIRGVGALVQLAVRDILPGEQITCDYAECNLDSPLECLCDTKSCRGAVRGTDLSVYARAWDREIADAVSVAAKVPQPLLPYATVSEWIRQVFAGSIPVPSIATVYVEVLEETLRATGARIVAARCTEV